MENKKRNIIFIIFAIIMGIFMLLVDVFLSINNFKLMLIAGVGILLSIFIILQINKKEAEDRENK